MPKRKAAESSSADSAKKAKTETKKSGAARGRGRPPLSAEEKEKRAALKQASKSPRGRGRPKGSTRPWLAFSPWIRKPLLFTQSPSLVLKSSPNSENLSEENGSNDENTNLHVEKRSDNDASSSRCDSDSDTSEVQDEAPSTLPDENGTDHADSSALNTNLPNQSLASNNEVFKPSSKDFMKKTDHHQGSSPQSLFSHSTGKSPSTPSTEEMEVLKLQKDKLSIEIEVLHLKKKKLILQLEQMAHSSSPYQS